GPQGAGRGARAEGAAGRPGMAEGDPAAGASTAGPRPEEATTDWPGEAPQARTTDWAAESPEARTEAGQVLGTPAYMPPEQANARPDQLDARADVFGLGALLCEILTGKPPYVARDLGELFRRARTADLADAFARLDGCGADAPLVALARSYLTADPAG